MPVKLNVLQLMKKKAIIASLWPLSILFALWLGGVLGTKIGIRAGKAIYHNENVRLLQMELSDASKGCTDLKVKETVDAVQQLISAMHDQSKLIAAGETLNARLKELQNQAPEDTARKLADLQR